MEHDAAVERAYRLIEAAQGHHDPALVEEADQAALANKWDDVRVLLHFARSLACVEDGLDDAEHVAAMAETAARHGDPALIALVTAVRATRQVGSRRTSMAGESVAALLVESVILLDETSDGRWEHRAAALIQVACVAHEMGFWELALEYYEMTERTIDGHTGETSARQLRVVTYNKADLTLDWACALAAIGDWSAAAERARTASRDDPTDDDWPPTWVTQYRHHCELLTALAGGVPTDDFGAAVAAARAGDATRAADLAEAAPERASDDLPTCAHLLRLGLIARRPGTNPAAIRYGDELALLRWNDRMDRMSGMRDAIAVERRRREHEKLRRDLVMDELTGLANRRGYQAYLAALENTAESGYAVMMIDVDHFKQVNDGFGHHVGDLVLARLGHILSTHVRPDDLAARMGGDEFLIILADVRESVLSARARQILESVRTYPWPEIAEGLAVSVSIGVHHGSHRELPTLLSAADRGLYQAKHDGRGQVATAVV